MGAIFGKMQSFFFLCLIQLITAGGCSGPTVAGDYWLAANCAQWESLLVDAAGDYPCANDFLALLEWCRKGACSLAS